MTRRGPVAIPGGADGKIREGRETLGRAGDPAVVEHSNSNCSTVPRL